MKRALTDAYLRAARPPASGRVEIRDAACRGLVLRVTAKGVKSWSFRFRPQNSGRVTRATIGQYPTITLGAARAAADAMRKQVAGGGNPAEQRRENRSGGKTFGVLAERYLAEYARRKKRSHAADDRNLRKHILPKWKDRNYASIRRGDVIALLESLVEAGTPTLANRVHSLISTIFTFGMDAGLVESHPCHRLKKRGVETVGQRVLSDPEIRLFWHGIAKPLRARRIGLALRLALLTATRVGEVAGICRSELEQIKSIAHAAWLIPGGRTKNGLDHLIPLNMLARETVLELLELIEPDQQFLLPTQSLKRAGPIRSNSITQGMANFAGRLEGEGADVLSWRADPPSPHDLRRTVETRLAAIGVPKEIRDRVLNHVPADVGSRHYNRYDYLAEKRAALERWSAALSGILEMPAEGAAVVSLAAHRGRA